MEHLRKFVGAALGINNLYGLKLIVTFGINRATPALSGFARLWSALAALWAPYGRRPFGHPMVYQSSNFMIKFFISTINTEGVAVKKEFLKLFTNYSPQEHSPIGLWMMETPFP